LRKIGFERLPDCSRPERRNGLGEVCFERLPDWFVGGYRLRKIGFERLR
jgi:hypothetical protein